MIMKRLKLIEITITRRHRRWTKVHSVNLWKL